MAFTAGTRLGPYEIVTMLGVGGMGEVYRATDTKLGRDVALKILPDHFTHDLERLARFRREAQVLASLNHPHIGAIYGVDQSGDAQFLVLELVDGESLDHRIARGPIPVDDTLVIAKQIAEALEAAHEKGIIHRDLKPANVAITRDGAVKVLDFGLAKSMEPASGSSVDSGNSATITSPAMMTRTGMILGTAAYMSPEQARGKLVDRRTDIWAFGCVLYEMLTRKKAFDGGETVSDAIATILKGDIDWKALPAETPLPVRTLLRRCLQKDPQKRLPHIGVARLEIEEGAIDPAAERASAQLLPPAPVWKRAAPIVIVALVVGALAASAAWRLKPEPPAPTARFTIPLPPDQTFSSPGRQMLDVSPDGTQIVYIANRRLNIRALGDSEPRPIAGTNDDEFVMQPVFSPDGRSVAFGTVQGVKRLPVTGGTAVTICPIRGGIFGMSWTADQIVFGEGSTRILRVSAAGGTPDVLVSVNAPEAVSSPQLLPDGDHLLFTHTNLANPGEKRWEKAHVVVQSLRSGERTTIVDGGADGRYLPNGHLTYAIGGVVYGAPFDVGRLAIHGSVEPVIDGVRRGGPTGTAQFAVSKTGSLAYLPGTPSSSLDSELFLADARGNATRLNVRGGRYEQPRLSPDGRYVAFSSTSSLDSKEGIVWVYELSGVSAMRRLTLAGNNRFPVWSADGQRVAYQSDRDKDLGLFWQRADGSGTAERLTTADQGTAHIPDAASPDGRHLLYTAIKGMTATLSAYSFPDRRSTQLTGIASRYPIAAVFAPNGRWIAYTSDDGTERRSRVYMQPFPPTGATYEIGVGTHPAWSADGRLLIMPRSPTQMGVVTVTTQPTVSFSDAVETNVKIIAAVATTQPRAFDIGRDGRMVGAVTAGTLDASGGRAEIRVVLNWFDELKTRVPTK